MAILIDDKGRGIDCWEPVLGAYFAKSTWNEEEAKAYAETGKYPERLAKLNAPEAA